MSSRTASILIVDDEADVLESLDELLKAEGYLTATASTAAAGLEKLGKEPFDLVLLDISLPDSNGIDVLRSIKRDSPEMPVIMITAYDSSQVAFQASREGADSYVTKPWDNDKLLLEIRTLLDRSRLRVENVLLRRALKRFGLPNIIGKSERMQKVYDLITQVAASRATVLITGETGTGKELVARGLHENSARAKGPLVVLDCGSIPENLIESEIFGHEKGSFTGATGAREGAMNAHRPGDQGGRGSARSATASSSARGSSPRCRSANFSRKLGVVP